MAMGQGLYAQVFMIRQKDSDNKKEKLKTKKYNFQGQSSISIHWFDINHEWLEENFMTREPYFYKNYIKQVVGFVRQKHINYL